MRLDSVKIILFFLTLSFFGCSFPQIPPEVRLAEDQEQSLWRAGASVYTPVEYTRYKIAIKKGREDIVREEAKFVWFRNYKPVETGFRDILRQGEEILKKVEGQKREKANSIAEQLLFFKNKIRTLRDLTLKINEGRLARKDLIKAELLLSDVSILNEKGEFNTAELKLRDISMFVTSAEESVGPIIDRYVDKNQIEKWQRWVEETVIESKDKGTTVIVVNKSDRTLTIYKNGNPFRTYNIGLGRNGSSDKLYAGDNATPEGKYHIIRKLPKSRYHKALLINYPSAEDRKHFLQAKKKGLVPQKAGIGGLIEIHGGGKDSMTYGCISMEDEQIEEVFNIVKIGTPVTIIGAVEYENRISSAIKGTHN